MDVESNVTMKPWRGIGRRGNRLKPGLSIT